MAQRSTNNPECRALAVAIGDNLKRRRLARSWTQAEVAETVGVSIEAFSRIERGLSLPSFPTLLRLAALYGTEAAELIKFGRTPPVALAGRNPRVTQPTGAMAQSCAEGQSSEQQTASLFLRLVDAARTIDAAGLEQLVKDAEAIAESSDSPHGDSAHGG